MKSWILAALCLFSLPVLASEKYALVVGTNYKGDSPVSDLELCERDAEKMKANISKTGNFKPENVRILLGAQVTRSALKSQIDSLASSVKEGDQVFFYFAGHGSFFRDDKAKNGMRNFLIMFNRPHISDDELSTWFASIRTKKAVIILDCCFSGGIAKKGAQTRGDGTIPIPDGSDSVVLQDLENVYFKDKVVISSADDNETAIELGAPINHGVFTYYFSEALLNADLNNDKSVTAYEAFFKARNDTTAAAKKVSHKQTPQISGNASGFFFVGTGAVIAAVDTKKPDTKKPDVNTQSDEIKLPPVKIETQETKTEQEKKPPITKEEPDNKQNTAKGILVLDTTYRQDIMKGANPSVWIGAESVTYRLKWADAAGWGKIAQMQIQNIPTGVHNVTIKAQGYPDKIIQTGIEKDKTTVEKVVASVSGRGAVSGKIFLSTFDRPVPNLMVFLKPIRIPTQPTVRTDENGAFIFNELKPGKYTVFVRGGLGVYSKPYDAEITIEENKVTQIDIVLKEFFKK